VVVGADHKGKAGAGGGGHNENEKRTAYSLYGKVSATRKMRWSDPRLPIGEWQRVTFG
jgi:hypothetical protein